MFNYHTIFLLRDGTVRTVGYNDYGQCGIGNTITSQLDILKPNIDNVVQVACGHSHTTFLLKDGTVRSVGRNNYSQCGMGNISTQLNILKPNIDNVVQVACGQYHTVFLLKDGTVRTAGYNGYGQCGMGNTKSPQLDILKPNIDNVVQVACGCSHTVFLLKDGTVRTVGNNGYGQCGMGNTKSPQLDILKPNIDNVVQIACGLYYTVFLLKDGTVRTVGHNGYGQCGMGNAKSPQLDILKPNIDNVVQINCGGEYTVFLLKDGTVRTVGHNGSGQCGMNTKKSPQLDILKPNIDNVTEVTCGNNHTIFLLKDGTVRAVGLNQYGQCGMGNNSNPQLSIFQPRIRNVKSLFDFGYNTPRYLIQDGNKLLTIDNNSIKIINESSMYTPTRLDFLNYGFDDININNKVLSQLNNPEILIYAWGIYKDCSKLNLEVKKTPLLNGKKILMFSEDKNEEDPLLSIQAIPDKKLIEDKNDIDLSAIKTIEKIELETNMVKLIMSFDCGKIWCSYYNGEWVEVDKNNLEEINLKGMDINVINTLTEEIEKLRNRSKTLRFAYLFNQKFIDERLHIDSINLVVTPEGTDEIAPNSDWEYKILDDNRTVEYKFLKNGIYTINYV